MSLGEAEVLATYCQLASLETHSHKVLTGMAAQSHSSDPYDVRNDRDGSYERGSDSEGLASREVSELKVQNLYISEFRPVRT